MLYKENDPAARVRRDESMLQAMIFREEVLAELKTLEMEAEVYLRHFFARRQK